MDVRSKMATGAIWMLAMRIAERGLGFVSTLVLVRLLAPEDFGLVAMAMSVIAILELLNAFGFEAAIIQRQEVKPAHLNTAWTYNLVFSSLTALLMVLVAGVAAEYYRDPRLEAVMWALAGSWFMAGFQNIGIVYFRKNLEFDKEFRFVFIRRILSFVTTLPLAIYMQSYWALIIGMLCGRLGGVCLSYLMHDYRPKLSLAASKELFGFSSWILVTNIIRVVNFRLSDFVIGRSIGTAALGSFRISSEFANLPTTELAAPIIRVAFPGFAKLKQDSQKLKDTFLDVLGMVALITLPAGVGISTTADSLVITALGTNWLEAIPVIQVLGCVCAIQCLTTNTAPLLTALGYVRSVTLFAALRLALLVPLLVIFVENQGIVGAAWAMLCVGIIVTPIVLWYVGSLVSISFVDFFSRLWRPVVASALMFFIVDNLSDLYDPGTLILVDNVLVLLANVVIGASVYSLICYMLWLAEGKPASSAERYIAVRLTTAIESFRRNRSNYQASRDGT